jgi:hypothetical protein
MCADPQLARELTWLWRMDRETPMSEAERDRLLFEILWRGRR